MQTDNPPVEPMPPNKEARSEWLDTVGKIMKPTLDMVFGSIEELHTYYALYAQQEGFSVAKSSRKLRSNGEVRNQLIQCSRGLKPTCDNTFQQRPLTNRTDCGAKVRASCQVDGRFKLSTIVLEHNHVLSPGKARFFRTNRNMSEYVKRRLELNDQPGIRACKNFNDALVVEAGGHQNLGFNEKDARNEKARQLRLGEGDAQAISNYFIRMQEKDSLFFYAFDLDTDGRIRNIFWADARIRATFESFGDVVTFDTTYLTKKYDMPFAPFVGVNHHGQSILLGCGLLSNEDMASYVWLFETWKTCMNRISPVAIITDKCKAMQRAIETVFPHARHSWCPWHIMKKAQENFKGYASYESICRDIHEAVFDSTTVVEFEEVWQKMLHDYGLEMHEWLSGLHEERHRWVPVYLKTTFWAGVSTTLCSETMNGLFDGYVNSKTTLKQFFEQYDFAMRNKVEKENLADFKSFNTKYECITKFEFEKQFQEAYTNEKFKEFREELSAVVHCRPSIVSCEDSTYYFNVEEDKTGLSEKQSIFLVVFDGVGTRVSCSCHLFEFRGIMCRHSLSVLNYQRVSSVPSEYILTRWRKDLKRKYTFVRTAYNDDKHLQQYDKMCNKFFELATFVADDEEGSKLVMIGLDELMSRAMTCVRRSQNKQGNQHSSGETQKKRKQQQDEEFQFENPTTC